MIRMDGRGQRSGRNRGQMSDVEGREKIMGCLNNLRKSVPAPPDNHIKGTSQIAKVSAI